MKLKLACADFTFPLLTHDGSLDLVASMDFDAIDIGLFEGRSHLWPSREFKDLGASARRLKRKLDDRGLKAADVFLQMDPDFVPYAINHPQAARRRKARDWFARTLEYARRLGAPHVTTLPGVHFETEPREKSLERSREELAWRLEQARDAKIVFSVEAHVGSIVSSPKEAEALAHSVPGLTLTLDYTHFTRLGMPDSDVEPLIALASHFHVRGARKGRLQASFRENTIDYARVLKMMRDTGYKGYLGIEYVWIDWEHCNEVDNVSETILYRDFLRGTAQSLGGSIKFSVAESMGLPDTSGSTGQRTLAALGLIEIGGLTPALVALDVLDKAAEVRLVQVELNDQLGALIKITGDSAAVRAAVGAAEASALRMHASCVTDVIDAPDGAAWPVVETGPEFSPLLEAEVVYLPNRPRAGQPQGTTENSVNGSFALGLIETQGLTAVLEAVDTACKAANVQVVGREKLGGGYVTVIIKGDVAAVKAAVEAGKAKVEGLGKLIAAHVIARPSEAVLSLLPKL